MTVFQHTTGFTRGEVDEALYDRFDVDFYRAANRFVENWFPDLTGAIQRRPGWQLAKHSVPSLWPTEPQSIIALETLPVIGSMTANFSFAGQDYVIVLYLYENSEGNETWLRILAFQVNDSDEFFVSIRYSTDYYTVKIADEVLTPERPLSQLVDFASIGPSMFVSSQLFPVHRVFFDLGAGDVDIEPVQWEQELLGTVSVANRTTQWDGEDTLFDEQLSIGDTFFFNGESFTVDNVTNNTSLQTVESYNGLTVAGERITIDVDEPFGGENPRLVTFHKGRLHLFATESRPTTWWASKAQNPFVIVAGSVYDDSPIEYDLLTVDADGFVWVQTNDTIYLGGTRGEYAISSPPDTPLTPTRFSFRRVSTVGGAPVRPFTAEAAIGFFNRGRTQLLRIQFDDNVQGFVEQDLSILAPHLLRDRIKDMAFRPATRADRVPRVFVLDDENQLRACALQERENVAAWSRLTVPDTVTPVALTSSADQVFVLVTTQDGDTTEFRLLRLEEDDSEYFVMDFQQQYAYAETLGLDAIFADSTVVVVSENRGFLGFFDVNSDAEIDLSDFSGESIETVFVGFPFGSRLDLLPVVIDDGRGGTLNRKHRIIRALLSVRGTYQLFVDGEPLFGSVGTQLGQEIPEQNGTFERRMLGWSERDEVRIEAAAVYRAKILSVTREVSA